METGDNSTQMDKKKFRLYEHVWWALLALELITVGSNILVSIVTYVLLRLPMDSPAANFATLFSCHALTVMVYVPFFLRLPKGKRTFRQYLEDSGLTHMQPVLKLVLLGLSCYAILVLAEVAASFSYRLFEGLPVTWSFLQQHIFNLSNDLPPSPSLYMSLPSIFEEVIFRGVLMAVFLSRYSERQSIFFSAIGFGLYHLIGLLGGLDLLWVMGNVGWAFILGLFYGYVYVKTGSLLPSMIVHYLGNVFISSLVGYLQLKASIGVQVLYGITITQGIVPVVLMILWTRFFVSRWIRGGQPDVTARPERLSAQAQPGHTG